MNGSILERSHSGGQVLDAWRLPRFIDGVATRLASFSPLPIRATAGRAKRGRRVASKKVKAGTPMGFDSLEPSFDVPVVAKRARGKAGTSELDLVHRPQTRLKLLALRAYLPVWFGVISNRPEPEAFYLDLFAGDGI
jgi:hypothetical protein